MHSPRAFLLFVAVRLLSVWAVRTWFVPDEYWQSLEVGHRLAFGYGHLTWEWTHGIRSYLHPVLIAAVYRLLAVAQLDTVQLLVLVPRVLQALLSAGADYRLYRWSGNSKWTAFVVVAAWFWWFCGSRTLSNTVEASLTTVALSVFPWRGAAAKQQRGAAGGEESCAFLWWVAVLAFVRPTALVPWLTLCVHHVRTSRYGAGELLLKRYLVIGSIVGAASITLDSLSHGHLIITPLEFVRVNAVQGIGAFYGTHPLHWYATSGLPTVLGITTVPFLFAASDTLRHRHAHPVRLQLLIAIGFTLATLSVLAHKEFRFVLALLPMCLYVVGDYLARWSRRASRLAVWAVALVLLAGNALPAAYLGLLHQAGTTGVMPRLAAIAAEQPDAKLLFLMPCHSTPFYSHVHRNVSMRFLHCEPNWSASADYVDEADRFYRAPAKWLRQHVPRHPVEAQPTHVVLFDVLRAEVAEFLAGYRLVEEVEHRTLEVGDARVGERVLVYGRLSAEERRQRKEMEVEMEMEKEEPALAAEEAIEVR